MSFLLGLIDKFTDMLYDRECVIVDFMVDTVCLTGEQEHCFSQADITDRKRSLFKNFTDLISNRMRFIVRREIKPLLHSEREIFISLITNQRETVKQTTLGVFKHIVKFLEEQLLTSFFILSFDMGFNSKTRQVNRMECEVSTTRCLFCTVDITYHACTTAHSRNRRIFDKLTYCKSRTVDFCNIPVITDTHIIFVNRYFKFLVFQLDCLGFILTANLNENFIIGKVNGTRIVLDIRLIERTINLYEVRVETTGKALDRLKIQVIVWIFRILCITLHQLENQNRENSSQTVTETFHLRLDKVLANHTTAIGSIKSEV